MLKVIAHKITALILIIILFANNINTLVIIGDFILNQDLIAKTLCIQKEEQKGCNGKCQLRKELSENNSNSNTSDNPLQESKRMSLDVFFLSTISQVENTFVSLKISTHNHAFKIPKISNMYPDIDTPPPNFS